MPMSGYRSLAASRAAIFYRNDVSESKIFAALRAAFQLSVAILESIPYLPMGVTASGGLKHTYLPPHDGIDSIPYRVKYPNPAPPHTVRKRTAHAK